MTDIRKVLKNLATKKDLEGFLKRLTQNIRNVLREQLGQVRKTIQNLHTDVKDIKRSTKFLEKEIIENRLKIKELEARLNKFTLPESKKVN